MSEYESSEAEPEPDSLQGCVRELVIRIRTGAANAACDCYKCTGEASDGDPVCNCDLAQMQRAMVQVLNQTKTEHFAVVRDMSSWAQKQIAWRTAVREYLRVEKLIKAKSAVREYLRDHGSETESETESEATTRPNFLPPCFESRWEKPWRSRMA